jgi:hypothetical protein
MQKKVKFIQLIYFLHSLLYIIFDLIHILIYYKIFWYSKISKNLFHIEILIFFGFIAIPIILVILLFTLKLNKKLFEIFHLLSKFLFTLYFFNGFLMSLVICHNCISLSSFFYYCPYNFENNDIPKIFDNFEMKDNKEIKKRCNYRRCFINNEYLNNNHFIYNFVCNFNDEDKMIDCSSMEENKEKISDELTKYVHYCNSYTKMYNCHRKNNFIIYNIPYYYKCPNKSDIYRSFIASFFIIFIDEFISSIPWIIEYYLFYEIILSITVPINNLNQINNLSLKETNNTSKINEDNNSNENDIENIRREPTQTIIIENKNNFDNSKKNVTINNIHNKDILSIKSNINNNKNFSQNKIKLNENNESQNQLINNPNKDHISIINYNIKIKEQKQ